MGVIVLLGGGPGGGPKVPGPRAQGPPGLGNTAGMTDALPTTPDAVLGLLEDGADVIVPLANGEPVSVLDAMEEHAERFRDVRVHQMHALHDRRYLHGEAVAYGMLVAAELSMGRGLLAAPDRQSLADLVASLGPLPPIADITTNEILEAMRHDKKVVAGTLHYVLLAGVGATSIVNDVTEEEIAAALVRVGFKG